MYVPNKLSILSTNITFFADYFNWVAFESRLSTYIDLAMYIVNTSNHEEMPSLHIRACKVGFGSSKIINL
jgi:hypothetical protein